MAMATVIKKTFSVARLQFQGFSLLSQWGAGRLAGRFGIRAENAIA